MKLIFVQMLFATVFTKTLFVSLTVSGRALASNTLQKYFSHKDGESHTIYLVMGAAVKAWMPRP